MIKYAEINGYVSVGEVAPHVYQWIQKMDPEKLKSPKKQKDHYGAMVIVRAYDTEPKVWVGYIFNDDKTYINRTSTPKRAYRNVELTLGGVEYVDDLKAFLKGSAIEEQFEEYEKTSWKVKSGGGN